MTFDDPRIERLCEVMHDAYEAAAVEEGWETQQASRKPWSEVPEANKATMRRAVGAVFEEAKQILLDEVSSEIHIEQRWQAEQFGRARLGGRIVHRTVIERLGVLDNCLRIRWGRPAKERVMTATPTEPEVP